MGRRSSRATFWQQQLGELSATQAELPGIGGTLAQTAGNRAAIAGNMGSTSVFVIPPEHDDVRRRIGELGMDREYAALQERRWPGSGQTYDCDITNELTRDNGNFRDPFHMTRSAAARVAKSIWSGNTEWCEPRPGGLRGSYQE